MMKSKTIGVVLVSALSLLFSVADVSAQCGSKRHGGSIESPNLTAQRFQKELLSEDVSAETEELEQMLTEQDINDLEVLIKDLAIKIKKAEELMLKADDFLMEIENEKRLEELNASVPQK